MRKLGIMALVLMIAWLAAGCSAPAAASRESDRLHFLEGELELSPDVQRWIRELCESEGAHVISDGGYKHVLVALGERQTAGYAVELHDLMEGAGIWRVEVTYVEPGPDDMVAMVITHPYLFLSVRTDEEIVVSRFDPETGNSQELTVADHD